VDSRRVLRRVAASPCPANEGESVARAQELGAVLVTQDPPVLTAFPRPAVSPADLLDTLTPGG
jgi:hypothetical protein